jgi:hypothetical protein
VSSDGRTGDGAGILLTFLMIFLIKSVILKFQKQENMSGYGFMPKKNQTDFVLLLLNRLLKSKI